MGLAHERPSRYLGPILLDAVSIHTIIAVLTTALGEDCHALHLPSELCVFLSAERSLEIRLPTAFPGGKFSSFYSPQYSRSHFSPPFSSQLFPSAGELTASRK